MTRPPYGSHYIIAKTITSNKLGIVVGYREAWFGHALKFEIDGKVDFGYSPDALILIQAYYSLSQAREALGNFK